MAQEFDAVFGIAFPLATTVPTFVMQATLTTRTWLRIIVPLLQVLILVAVFSLDPLLGGRYVGRSELYVAYINTPEHLLLKLNFPLVVVGLPLLYLTAGLFPNAGSTHGVLSAVIFGVYLLVVLAGTAGFWYLVVVETERRKSKTSCLRFSGRQLERLKAVVLILIGAGAAVYALWDGHTLLIYDQINRHYFFWSAVIADALIGGLFLFGWAAALITMGVQDFVRASGST